MDGPCLFREAVQKEKKENNNWVPYTVFTVYIFNKKEEFIKPPPRPLLSNKRTHTILSPYFLALPFSCNKILCAVTNDCLDIFCILIVQAPP